MTTTTDTLADRLARSYHHWLRARFPDEAWTVRVIRREDEGAQGVVTPTLPRKVQLRLVGPDDVNPRG